MMEKNRFLCWVLGTLLMLPVVLMGCSSSDDDDVIEDDGGIVECPILPPVYAVVVEEGEDQSVIGNYIALTLDNIVAVNPQTGLFLLKDAEHVIEKSYPLPTQYCIRFFAGERFLFEAKLNNVICNYLPTGLTFLCYSPEQSSDGTSFWALSCNVIHHDGQNEGELTEQQEKGIQELYEILDTHGLTDSHLGYLCETE